MPRDVPSEEEWVDSADDSMPVAAAIVVGPADGVPAVSVADRAVARRMHSSAVRERWMSGVFGSDSTGSDDAEQPEDAAAATADAAVDAAVDASSPALGPADEHFMTKPAIMAMKVLQLKGACLERSLQQTGNKAHLQHRLLRLCGHIPWNTPPPPGGSRAERAAATFFAPGHENYDTNNFIITTGMNGEPPHHLAYRAVTLTTVSDRHPPSPFCRWAHRLQQVPQAHPLGRQVLCPRGHRARVLAFL